MFFIGLERPKSSVIATPLEYLMGVLEAEKMSSLEALETSDYTRRSIKSS